MSKPANPNDQRAFAEGTASSRPAALNLGLRTQNEAATKLQKVLLVEDDFLMRELLCATLSPEHYEIVKAGTAAEALQLITKEHPSIVILDIRLPDQSGIDVCRAIRADPVVSSIPVIAVTAVADVAAKEAGFAAGIDRYITKPFSPLQLLRTVEELVHS